MDRFFQFVTLQLIELFSKKLSIEINWNKLELIRKRDFLAGEEISTNSKQPF